MSDTQTPSRPNEPPPVPILPVPPSPPPKVQPKLRRLGVLAAALSVLLPIAAVANGYVAFAFFDRASLLGGPLPTFREVSEADDRVGGAIAMVILLQFVVGVVWIVWQFRHARNAARLGHQHQLGPGWAIGGWFVPVGNLFLPYRQLLDSARASAGGPHPVLYVWWAAMVAGGLVAANGFRLHSSDVRAADQMRGAGFAVLAVAAVLAVVVVQVSTTRQRRAS